MGQGLRILLCKGNLDLQGAIFDWDDMFKHNPCQL